MGFLLGGPFFHLRGRTGNNVGRVVKGRNVAFVFWCHGQAGYPQPRTAWSPSLFPAERQVEVATSRRAPRNDVVGLVLGIYYPDKDRIWALRDRRKVTRGFRDVY